MRKLQTVGAVFLGAALLCLSPFPRAEAKEVAWTGNEWNVSEQEMKEVKNLKLGREDARSSFFPFADEEKALASQQVGEERKLEDAYYQSLDTAAGQTWKFYYVAYPAARAQRPDNDHIMNPDYDDSAWDEITVPKNWEASYNEDGTFKYNPPQYSNTDYPWITQKPNPSAPHAPTQFNPVGFYRTKITVDPSFKGRKVFLNFEGVESAFYVWVNGHQVGFSEDSFTSKEFQIDEYLNYDGNDTLAVEVFKWSSGSWFEDQDMLRLAGIFRSVYLTSKDQVELRDFTINTVKAGEGIDPQKDYEDFTFDLYANIRDLGAEEEAKEGLQVSVSLYDPDGKKVPEAQLENSELTKTINAGDFTGTDSLGRPESTVKLSACVKNPKKWSAEQPNLYKALITLRDAEGKIVETTAYRFGFRMIEIRNQGQPDAQMIINGQPLLIKGVNVHENNYQTGRAMTYELIKKDVTVMKQNNFNGIRMSHYSHDFRYYDLADEMGMYICDETNLETHGNRSIPSNNFNYLPAALDRLSSMFYRSKNYPSVIIHSLGNEAGSGSVFAQMNKWLKGTYEGTPDFYLNEELKGDLQKRPIHYEGDNSNADIQSNMYPSVEETLRYSQVNKPYILCEYSHAMGTSGGYYQKYWDAFESRENIQGGFIWDWVDQSMLTYVDPEAFPAQPSLGWKSGTIVSQDQNQTKIKPGGGPDCLASKGVSGESGDYALSGSAYAEVTPEILNFNGSFTIEAWVNPKDTSRSSRTIVAKGDNQYKLQTVNGTVQFNTFCGGWNELEYVYEEESWAGNWHHVVATYDAGTKTARLYCDDMSEPAAEKVFTKAKEDGTFDKSGQKFGVGYDSQNASSRDWNGLLDRVHVYDKALTAEEIADENRAASDEHVLYWEDFDGGMETEGADVSNVVYSITSQDPKATKTTLIRKEEALSQKGPSGAEGDKALAGPAVAKNTPSQLDMNGAFTIEAWVYPTENSGVHVIAGKGDTQYVLRTQNGQLCLQLYSNTGGNWNQLLYTYDSSWAGKWHHVAAAYDAETKTARMYVDDMAAPAVETVFTNVYEDGSFNRNGDDFAVGRETTNTSRDWQGLIDDVHLYNRALSAEELSAERSADDENVVFWQDFNGETESAVPVIKEGYAGFGGDWGDAPNSSNFCANGIVSTQRVPHGAMLEIKRVHQDYVMELGSASLTEAELHIRSRALFTDAAAYDFVWELKENEKTIREGSMEVEIAPLASRDLTISYDAVEPKAGKTYYLTCKFVLKADTPWAKAGHEISAAQAKLDFETAAPAQDDLEKIGRLTYEETEDSYTVTGQDFTMVFDRGRGTIVSLIYKGTEMFAQDGTWGPAPNFWRAPTDGDRLSNISTTWRYAGAERTAVVSEAEQVNSREVKIRVSGKLAPSQGSADYTMTFTVYGDGQILVENTMTPEGFSSRDLIPVIGNEMQLASQFEQLTWYGRGSDQEGLASESYPDRYAQQFVGLYEEQVDGQFIPYVRNQTFGNKMDVQWAALTDESGRGLVISAAGEALNLNAQHYTQEELTSFGSKHPYESQKTDHVVLNVDYKNMAVGYDPGWLSKGWYEEEDMIRPTQAYTYQYKLSPTDHFTVQKGFEISSQSYSTALTEKEALVRESLERVIRKVESLDPREYTAESWEAVSAALAETKGVWQEEGASRAELEAVLLKLIQAYDGLEYGVQTVHLETVMDFVDQLLKLENNYEPEDIEALKAARENGRAVYDDPQASQEEADAAVYEILDVLARLSKAADVESLESLLEAAKGLLDEGKYTEDTVKALEEAIRQAEAVLEDPNRSETAVSDAYGQVIDAVRGLKLRGNKAALRAMIAKAEEILSSKEAYVPSSIETLEEILQMAKEVDLTQDALQEEIDGAVKTLTETVAKARLLGDVDGDGAVTTGDARAVLRAAAECEVMSQEQAESADVNRDGTVNTADAAGILQYSAEKIAGF